MDEDTLNGQAYDPDDPTMTFQWRASDFTPLRGPDRSFPVHDQAHLRNALARVNSRHIVVLPPMPRRRRLRLWWEGRVTRLCSWLCGRKMSWLAILLWKLNGMWDE